MLLHDYEWLDQTAARQEDFHDTGWQPLIDRLLLDINSALAGSKAKLHLLQIKEKLGGLRFYYDLKGASPMIEKQVQALVAQAYQEAERTCMKCGEPGKVIGITGLMICVCEKHAISVRHARSL